MTGQEAYLGELQRLANVCRSLAESEAEDPVTDLEAMASRIEALETEVAELRASRQLASDTSEILQRRIAALEKSLPPPRIWADLIRGIGAVRESVVQLQNQQREESPTCRPA